MEVGSFAGQNFEPLKEGVMSRKASSPSGRLGLRLAGLVLAAASLLPVPVWPLDTPETRATLKGVPLLRVNVDVDTPGLEQDGLTKERLQKEVERRLEAAGIVVAPITYSALPVLWVVLTTDKVPAADLFAASIKVAFFQYVRIRRSLETGAPAATWEVEGVGSVPASDASELRSWVVNYVDRFITAYREQNPKKAPETGPPPLETQPEETSAPPAK
jgi:hypothetical protein